MSSFEHREYHMFVCNVDAVGRTLVSNRRWTTVGGVLLRRKVCNAAGFVYLSSVLPSSVRRADRYIAVDIQWRRIRIC